MCMQHWLTAFERHDVVKPAVSHLARVALTDDSGVDGDNLKQVDLLP